MTEILWSMKSAIFVIDLIVHYILLFGIVWSVAFPKKRVWPPPKKWSWQYIVTWVGFYAAFILNGLLVVLDWNSWVLENNIRFFVGIPLVITGVLFFLWAFTTLGAENTSGVKSAFVRSGPYRHTRNPQYVGDIFLFAGVILISNSVYLLILNSLLSLVFLITPMAEEVWLEDQYGGKYLEYKQEVPRFL